MPFRVISSYLCYRINVVTLDTNVFRCKSNSNRAIPQKKIGRLTASREIEPTDNVDVHLPSTATPVEVFDVASPQGNLFPKET